MTTLETVATATVVLMVVLFTLWRVSVAMPPIEAFPTSPSQEMSP